MQLEIARTKRAASSLLSKGGDLETFLKTDVAAELEIRNVGQHHREMGIRRHHLLSTEALGELELGNMSVTKGAVIELLIFQHEEGQSFKMLRQWLEAIGLNISGLSDKQLRTRLAKTRQPYDKLKNPISKPNTKQNLEEFLQTPTEFFEVTPRSQQTQATSEKEEPSSATSASAQPSGSAAEPIFSGWLVYLTKIFALTHTFNKTKNTLH